MDSQQFKYPATPRAEADALKVLIGGILGMVVAMGIGRFIFTPILPLMQRDLGMTNSVAGWLAGLNYLGYLAGAIVCSVTPGMLRSWLITGGSLFVSIATTLFMGATLSVHWWGLMRFAGGFASAVLFIVITAEVGETLSRRGYGHWLGALYGGVGLGIAISGLVVPPLDNIGGWIGAWYGAGLLAAILAVVGLLLGRRRELVKPITIDESRTPVSLSSVRLLAVGYFFEGLGYIVTATFLVAIISMTPGLEDFAPYSWVAVGLAAVPSTIFWPYLGRRIGNRKALLGAYLLQAAGILVSVWAESMTTVLFVAVSFGGTFLGIVALTLTEGNLRMPGDGRRAAAFLTASFGVGQVLGPVLAGTLADTQEGFAVPLVLATVCVAIAGLCVLLDRQFQSQ
ncbi:MAG: YbfB/YjiJ family MFS transporter [Deltaproteobacteria bacterium]|jgi:MFS family permease|nr:YbfB/YjiJ family MFS transporter [Deltaproteobacteria bacterium]